MFAADTEKQEEACTSSMWTIRRDSCKTELQQTAGEIETNSNTMHNNDPKTSMCNAMKVANK